MYLYLCEGISSIAHSHAVFHSDIGISLLIAAVNLNSRRYNFPSALKINRKITISEFVINKTKGGNDETK